MTPSIRAALVLSALAAAPAFAQEDPEEPPYDIEQEELESEEPPFELKRPNDSWVFIDLEAMRERAEARRQDTSGYATLKGRLWYGGARSNIYVHVFPSSGPAPELQALGEGYVERTRNSLRDAEVLAQGAGRVGRRRAWLLEVEGQPPTRLDAPRIRILRAVLHRPEDDVVFVFTLECELLDRYDDAKEDFMKLLRKARL